MLRNRRKKETRKNEDYYQLHDFTNVSSLSKTIDDRPFHTNHEYQKQEWYKFIEYLKTTEFVEYCKQRTNDDKSKTSVREIYTVREELPTSKEFILIVEFLARKVMPNYRVRDGRKEESLTYLFGLLGYSFNSKLLSHVSAPHSWPFMLGALTWLKSVVDVMSQPTEQLRQSAYEMTGIEATEVEIVREFQECAFECYKNQQYEDVAYSEKLNSLIQVYMNDIDTQTKEVNEKFIEIQNVLNELENVPFEVEGLQQDIISTKEDKKLSKEEYQRQDNDRKEN
ncbi:hypothetical protein QTN25_001725 [Entamoeba marina]